MKTFPLPRATERVVRLLWAASVLVLMLAASALAPAQAQEAAAPVVDKGDVAWMLVSTLLVLLMAMPGLALFYGGMVRAKNVLSVLTQVMTCLLYTSPSPRDRG